MINIIARLALASIAAAAAPRAMNSGPEYDQKIDSAKIIREAQEKRLENPNPEPEHKAEALEKITERLAQCISSGKTVTVNQEKETEPCTITDYNEMALDLKKLMASGCLTKKDQREAKDLLDLANYKASLFTKWSAYYPKK